MRGPHSTLARLQLWTWVRVYLAGLTLAIPPRQVKVPLTFLMRSSSRWDGLDQLRFGEWVWTGVAVADGGSLTEPKGRACRGSSARH